MKPTIDDMGIIRAFLEEYRLRAPDDMTKETLVRLVALARKVYTDDLVRALLAVERKQGAHGSVCSYCSRYDGHDPICALDTALRKAGAR